MLLFYGDLEPDSIYRVQREVLQPPKTEAGSLLHLLARQAGPDRLRHS